MRIKQLSAIALSAVFSLGALSAVAYDDDHNSAFEVLDQNSDGVIDRDEANQSGITDQQFDEMDQAGDDVITSEEYREYESGEGDNRQDQQHDDW